MIILKSSDTQVTMTDLGSIYTLPNNQPVVPLICEPAFNNLTPDEKLYTHYLSRASWHGSLIIPFQISPEAPLIIALLLSIFYYDQDVSKLKKNALANNVSEDEFQVSETPIILKNKEKFELNFFSFFFQAFLVYSAGILDNMGNYKSFGDTKFIPNLPSEKFHTIIKSSKAYREENSKIRGLWKKLERIMYALDDNLTSLGYSKNGVTTYFSSNCDEEDARRVTEFMQFYLEESYNTRVFKSSLGNKPYYNIRLASVKHTNEPPITVYQEHYKDSVFTISRGDYSSILPDVVSNLRKAFLYAANENQREMLKKYVSHFMSGSLDDHKDGSRFWIKDKGPTVETYIGFIENYRDPAGERAEFEGIVGIVNKEKSKRFATLVKNAPTFLEVLPWGKNFEKDVFLKPDFSSLDMITMGSSGMVSGINIPNYDEIRQTEGFKNVHLSNIISAQGSSNFDFLSDEDVEMFRKYKLKSFDIQVGLHELLGHGSGKLLYKYSDGSSNFDENMINPLTGKKVDKYYEEGETYDTKFGSMGSSLEECRAEAVGLYLSLERDILRIFGHEGKEAADIVYSNWLSLFYAGVKALEVYQPETKQWLQAHSRARFVLLQVCLEAGEDLVRVRETENGTNLRLELNRNKIGSLGRKAIGRYLLKSQVYKSTGDAEEAAKMYDKYSEVSDEGKYPWARWRNIVLSHTKPRQLFVQPNTFEVGNNVVLKNYNASVEGVIESWVDRFPYAPDLVDKFVELFDKDAHHYRPIY